MGKNCESILATACYTVLHKPRMSTKRKQPAASAQAPGPMNHRAADVVRRPRSVDPIEARRRLLGEGCMVCGGLRGGFWAAGGLRGTAGSVLIVCSCCEFSLRDLISLRTALEVRGGLSVKMRVEFDG